MRLWPGLRPDPVGGAYSAPQTPWLVLRGARLESGKGKGGEGREGRRGAGREGKGREG